MAPRSVFAVVLAGGPPDPGFGPDAPRHRPLLPFRGRPIVTRVLDALGGSRVAGTWVLHDGDCPLEGYVAAGPSTRFTPLPLPAPPIGESVLLAFQGLVDTLGIEAVRRSRFLILPCDQPFVTSAVIDRVIARAETRVFDFAYTIVAADLLEARYPGRRFRNYPVADLGGRFALQTATMVDGGFLGVDALGRVTFGDWGSREASALFRTISALRDARRSPWQVPHFFHELVYRRLRGVGGVRLMVETAARFMVGRLRTVDAARLTRAAYRIRVTHLDTGSPELSADIDRPEDLEGHPWHPAPLEAGTTALGKAFRTV